MIFTSTSATTARLPVHGPARRGLRTAVTRAVVATALVAASLTWTPPVAAEPNGDPYVPPSITVEMPSTDDCAQRSQPPPPVDTSEDLPPGTPAPAPIPVPAYPVGGGRLGECGLIIPDGAGPLPSDISAGAWVIADLDTGEVLAAKDPHGRYRPASTLKLLTAQVLLHTLNNLDLVVEATSADSDQDGTRVGLEAGGKYTVRQLLTYLLIISGNDAANALARTNGGYDQTVAEMNATANALGALDTRAATVAGLDGAGQATSAYDLALFAKADMATPLFPELISTQEARVPSATDAGYVAANDNQLIYQYQGALGGKTGFTDDAGNTYVGLAARNGRRLVVTMMHGTQQPRRQWMQAASLLDWGFALPVTTPPVGTLVGSLAEATAVPVAPTVSTGAPVSPGSAGGQSAAAGAAPASTVEPPAGTSSSSAGAPTALILAGIGLLIVVLGVLLLLRRRHLNKRPAVAGDTEPAADAALEESGTVESGAVESGAVESAAPTTPQPGEPEPDAAQPGTAQPDAAQPGTEPKPDVNP